MTGETRRKEIRTIHKEYKWHYVVMLVVVALAVGIWIGAAAFAEDITGYWMNLATEGMGVVVSIAVTVIVIDRIYERRDRQRLKARLLREAGSRSNDIAISAVEWLSAEDLLKGENGLLKEATLVHANLRNANLWFANLHGTSLIGANLQKAVLTGARLKDTCLFGAELQEAQLSGAKLQRATLSYANAQGADLANANLQGARLDGTDLMGADLREANLEGATYRSDSDFAMEYYTEGNITVRPPTILPDGKEYSHTVNLKEFTDPNDPNYIDKLKQINELRSEMGVTALEYSDSRAHQESVRQLMSVEEEDPL